MEKLFGGDCIELNKHVDKTLKLIKSSMEKSGKEIKEVITHILIKKVNQVCAKQKPIKKTKKNKNGTLNVNYVEINAL